MREPTISARAFLAGLVVTLTVVACTTADDSAADADHDRKLKLYGEVGGVERVGNPDGAQAGGSCANDHDCFSGNCVANLCADVSCADGILNGDETGTDCGGPTCKGRCAVGQTCWAPGDCVPLVGADVPTTCAYCGNGNCDVGRCQVQCGDDTGRLCAAGAVCFANEVCASSICTTNNCVGDAKPGMAGAACANDQACDDRHCVDKTCVKATCADGIRNGTETDVDCGGGCGPCTVGKGCLDTALDCVPRSADNTKVVCFYCMPTAANPKGDCAVGRCEPVCGAGKEGRPTCYRDEGCWSSGDCIPDVANPNGLCEDQVCRSGPIGPVTPVGKDDGAACAKAADCKSQVCTGGTCRACTDNDGVKNCLESDVDCGGGTAKKCGVEKTCRVHADCTSDGCDEDYHCAPSRSCTQRAGGTTCGAGDSKEPGHQHKSCCSSIPIPGQGVSVDEFQITAGRMRAFVNRVKGDVKGWVQANRASLPAATQATLPAAFDQYLPTTDPKGALDPNFDPSFPFTGDFGVAAHLGGTIFLPDRPSLSQGCFIGADDNNYYSGAHTFTLDAAERSVAGEVASVVPQARADEKALNCVTYPMVAAFCAWDGGRLVSRPHIDAAYGAATYPWGASPEPAGFGVPFQCPGSGAAFPNATADPTRANYVCNYFVRAGSKYEQSTRGDFVAFVAPPGRYPAGRGPFGHSDLAGNVFDWTSTVGPIDAKAGTPLYGTTYKWSRNGSFEGHGIGGDGYAFTYLTKYGKAGGRCER